MSSNPDYDRWYAARHVRILLSPSHRLETFGNTLVNYHLISELDDHPGKIRVREGRLEAHQPLVIAPHFAEVTAEGFSDEAKAYVEWLKANEESLRILRYGYCLKTSHDGFAAVLQGVDEPWDVALVELWRREVDKSFSQNVKELDENGKLFG